jgi:hypothetical protein
MDEDKDKTKKDLIKQIIKLNNMIDVRYHPPVSLGELEKMPIDTLECIKKLSEHQLKRAEDERTIKTYRYMIKLMRECAVKQPEKITLYDHFKVNEMESMINEYESIYLK